MKVVYHPAVQRDVSKILRHYDSINDRLGDEFWNELNAFIVQAVANPGRFHFESHGRRRVNLRRFPYYEGCQARGVPRPVFFKSGFCFLSVFLSRRFGVFKT